MTALPKRIILRCWYDAQILSVFTHASGVLIECRACGTRYEVSVSEGKMQVTEVQKPPANSGQEAQK